MSGYQLTHHSQALGGVAGKARDGLRQDVVDFAVPSVIKQRFAALRFCAADAAVNVNVRQFPLGIGDDIRAVMLLLIVNGSLLGLHHRGDAAVGGDAELLLLRRSRLDAVDARLRAQRSWLRRRPRRRRGLRCRQVLSETHITSALAQIVAIDFGNGRHIWDPPFHGIGADAAWYIIGIAPQWHNPSNGGK